MYLVLFTVLSLMLPSVSLINKLTSVLSVVAQIAKNSHPVCLNYLLYFEPPNIADLSPLTLGIC